MPELFGDKEIDGVVLSWDYPLQSGPDGVYRLVARTEDGLIGQLIVPVEEIQQALDPRGVVQGIEARAVLMLKEASDAFGE